MRRRIRKLRFRLWLHKGVDIVVTHAAPAGLGDDDDPAHWGFEALRELLDKYQPKVMLHGHVHLNYGQNVKRELSYGNTTVINATERYTLEMEEGQYRQKDKNCLIWKNGEPKVREILY
jgi:Icc-related predicted phosphoesterase